MICDHESLHEIWKRSLVDVTAAVSCSKGQAGGKKKKNLVNNIKNFNICVIAVISFGSCMTRTTTRRQDPTGQPTGQFIPYLFTSQLVDPVKNTTRFFPEKLHKFCRNMLQPQVNSIAKLPHSPHCICVQHLLLSSSCMMAMFCGPIHDLREEA